MQKSEIQIGQEYVLREGKDPEAPLQRVKIIQHVRGKKWKAEWIDPNPGLVDYIGSQNLVVRWKDRKAYFHDEERARRIREDNERRGYKEESPWGTFCLRSLNPSGRKILAFTAESSRGVPKRWTASGSEQNSIPKRILTLPILIALGRYIFLTSRPSNLPKPSASQSPTRSS